MGTVIENLFPAEVRTARSSGPAEFARLLPGEAACVARAAPKRRHEFAAGRLLAREALAISGFPEFPLLVGADRAPKWPAGMIGSISHCDGLCAVAVARRGRILALGLDLETADPLPEEIVERVCTASEVRRARASRSTGAPDWLKLVFSAKESVYKALRGLALEEFDFPDLEIEFQPAGRRFMVNLLKPSMAGTVNGLCVEGRYAWTDDHVATGVAVLGNA